MKTRILVPLDGSALAEQALSCAVMLGEGLSAELVLLRAVSVPTDARKYLGRATAIEGDLLQQLEREASKYLSQVADRVQLAGLDAETVVRHGPAADTIVDSAEQMEISQIVMATHGYGGLRRWTHGSVAERVLQAASMPVLMVRAREEEAETSQKLTLCRRILVPLDGSVRAEQVLSPAAAVAKAVGAEVFLFQVAFEQPASMFGEDWLFLPADGEFDEEEREAQQYLATVADRLEEKGIQVSVATDVGPVAECIVEYAEANDIDLTAMCTHGRTGLARWVYGSVAERVLRAGGTPVLLVRAR